MSKIVLNDSIVLKIGKSTYALLMDIMEHYHFNDISAAVSAIIEDYYSIRFQSSKKYDRLMRALDAAKEVSYD